MSFRLVPNDLERRSGPYSTRYFTELGSVKTGLGQNTQTAVLSV